MGSRFDPIRLPDGAKITRHDGNDIEMRITMPVDDDGFFGRQCPDCTQLFRVNSEDYDPLPDDLQLWCVYCGHHTDHSDFLTQQQRERAERAVGDLGVQLIGRALDDSLGRLARGRRSRSPIKITYRSTPFYPQPLPGIDEERLIRERRCTRCDVRYAVFGEHRYCPVCGPLPPDVVALDALTAETARLDALDLLPADVASDLREQGVFTRIWVDTLKSLVGVVESLASATFQSAVADAAQRVHGKGNVFQRPDDFADQFATAGYQDLRAAVGSATWQRIRQVWATRHVFTHNDGFVDERYLAKVTASTAVIGQRLSITERFCRQAIADTRELCLAIASLTTS